MKPLALFSTDLGWMGLAVAGKKVCGLTFGHRSSRQAATAQKLRDTQPAFECVPDEAFVELMVDRLGRYAAGESIDFKKTPILVESLTNFQKCVLKACQAIPYGETLTYGELAKQVGHPGAARAVGSVMAKNRIPLIVPCHRVVPSTGGLGGFSAPQGVKMKHRLLLMERNAEMMAS